MFHYKPGDVIAANTWRSGERIVLVDTHEADVKNGQPGFTGTLCRVEDGVAIPVTVDGVDGVWGYDQQVTRIVLRSVVSA